MSYYYTNQYNVQAEILFCDLVMHKNEILESYSVNPETYGKLVKGYWEDSGLNNIPGFMRAESVTDQIFKENLSIETAEGILNTLIDRGFKILEETGDDKYYMTLDQNKKGLIQSVRESVGNIEKPGNALFGIVLMLLMLGAEKTDLGDTQWEKLKALWGYAATKSADVEEGCCLTLDLHNLRNTDSNEINLDFKTNQKTIAVQLDIVAPPEKFGGENKKLRTITLSPNCRISVWSQGGYVHCIRGAIRENNGHIFTHKDGKIIKVNNWGSTDTGIKLDDITDYDVDEDGKLFCIYSGSIEIPDRGRIDNAIGVFVVDGIWVVWLKDKTIVTNTTAFKRTHDICAVVKYNDEIFIVDKDANVFSSTGESGYTVRDVVEKMLCVFPDDSSIAERHNVYKGFVTVNSDGSVSREVT